MITTPYPTVPPHVERSRRANVLEARIHLISTSARNLGDLIDQLADKRHRRASDLVEMQNRMQAQLKALVSVALADYAGTPELRQAARQYAAKRGLPSRR